MNSFIHKAEKFTQEQGSFIYAISWISCLVAIAIHYWLTFDGSTPISIQDYLPICWVLLPTLFLVFHDKFGGPYGFKPSFYFRKEIKRALVLPLVFAGIMLLGITLFKIII